jgi:UDP-N-acetylmuramoyl-tripeptide--D-alanyl-D-alanine ligase
MSVALELREAAEVMGARLVGAGPGFHGVSTDSRKVRPGSLFIALRGTRTDGHDHVASAFAGGAVAALVERELSGVGPLLVVDDAVAGLGRLAAGWRARHDLPLIGITGSTGKTTVKEMAAAILGRRGPVLATRGNLNNHIGLPLTLLELGPGHLGAVIEMGANHAGEIAYLADRRGARQGRAVLRPRRRRYGGDQRRRPARRRLVRAGRRPPLAELWHRCRR